MKDSRLGYKRTLERIERRVAKKCGGYIYGFDREYMKKMLEMEKQKLDKRYEKAWEVAKQIACILRQKYGANKVWVFGSLTNKEMFNQWSDIDIAVEGIPSEYYYKAVAEVISFSVKYKIDIVDIIECSPLMQENIKREGILI